MWVFPNVYRIWSREQGRWAAIDVVEDDDLNDTVDVRGGDVADHVVCRLELQRILGDVHATTRAVLWLSAWGYSQEETAELLGITKRAVEGLLYRFRRHNRDSGRSP